MPASRRIPLVLLTALAVTEALSIHSSGDYVAHGAVGADNAGPALLALVHGDLAGFAARQPVMGLASLLVRLPLVALASALGGGPLTIYRAGVFACLLVAGALALYLGRDATPGSALRVGVLLAVLLVSPLVRDGLTAGHPEELLAATAATAAVLLACDGRPGAAGLVLGLAVASKSWALVAVAPVAVALPAQRRSALVNAAAVAAVLAGGPILADPHAFFVAARSFGSAHLVTAFSAWWPVRSGSAVSLPLVARLPFGLTKSDALAAALVVAFAVQVLAWRFRRVDPLALLVLGAIVRVLGDSAPVGYYAVAVLVPLAAWEVVVAQRPPLAALVASVGVARWFDAVAGAPDLVNALTLIGGAAVAVYVTRGSASLPVLKRLRVRPIRRTCDP